MLKASVLQGESQAMHYVRLIDGMFANNNEPQLYGTQREYDSKGILAFLIKDPEYANTGRKEPRLLKIQDFAEQIGVKWGGVRQ